MALLAVLIRITARHGRSLKTTDVFFLIMSDSIYQVFVLKHFLAHARPGDVVATNMKRTFVAAPVPLGLLGPLPIPLSGRT